MANSNNTDPKYWERQLKKYGLGIYQPITDNSEGEMADNVTEIHHIRGKSEDHMRLRAKLDGAEGFMEGHQIMKVQTKKREVPEWALNDGEVRRILLTAFPKMHTNTGVGKRQRVRAGQWLRLIHLYYRMKLPYQIVSKELGMDYVLMSRWIQKINYVSKGLTIDGKQRRPSHTKQPMK